MGKRCSAITLFSLLIEPFMSQPAVHIVYSIMSSSCSCFHRQYKFYSRGRKCFWLSCDQQSAAESLLNISHSKYCYFECSHTHTHTHTHTHLRNISKIRHVLSQKDAKKLVHAFVTSRLDYCNSLLSGSSSKSLETLQLVQNSAARVLTRTRKRDHISPVLASLHWLPVKSRITF